MREIKFRVWNSERKKWTTCGMFHSNTQTKMPIVGLSVYEKCVPLQFTGLHDRNGKEIYEGDVLNCYNWGVTKNELLTVSEIYWDIDEKGWGLNPDPTDGDRYDLFRNIEIIGNIYENPELLTNKS